MLSLPRFLSSINGVFGFGYDVLDSFNTPSILDIEAYAQAKANASLNTKLIIPPSLLILSISLQKSQNSPLQVEILQLLEATLVEKISI